MARYNFERFSNNLSRVVRYNNFREPIAEAYFPKMDSLVASRAWPARASNTRISDLNRELDQIRYDVRDLEQWVSRFVEACHQGYVQDVRSMFNSFDLCGNSKPKTTNKQTSTSTSSAIIISWSFIAVFLLTGIWKSYHAGRTKWYQFIG